jgi:hypothetical protein
VARTGGRRVAFVPDDGGSCWSMTNDEQRDWYSLGSGATGLAVEPLSFRPRGPARRPHAEVTADPRVHPALEGH